jgi:hypothetical protein
MMTIRSFFFGGLAMLAAAIFMYSPALAMERGPGLYAASHVPDTPVYDLAVAPVVIPDRIESPKRSDAHNAVYIRANQPLTTWRVATDQGYAHIDPHISL